MSSIPMLDVSSFQSGLTDEWWKTAYANGYRFVAIRVWDGRVADARWVDHHAMSRIAGFKTIPYCDAPFSSVQPVDAGTAVRQIVASVEWDGPLFVDWESAGGYPRFDPDVWRLFTRGAGDAGIYSSLDYDVSAASPRPVARWVADWGVGEAPSISDLAAWQRGTLEVDGIDVDYGEWYGVAAVELPSPPAGDPVPTPVPTPPTTSEVDMLEEILHKLDNHWTLLQAIEAKVDALQATLTGNPPDVTPTAPSSFVPVPPSTPEVTQ